MNPAPSPIPGVTVVPGQAGVAVRVLGVVGAVALARLVVAVALQRVAVPVTLARHAAPAPRQRRAEASGAVCLFVGVVFWPR